MAQNEPMTLDYGRPPKRRSAISIFLCIAKWFVIAIAGLILFLIVVYLHAAWYRPRQVRSEAIEALSPVKTLEECKPILEGGTWLQMRDGSWIAIRYEDCHGPSWSMSVAIDSSGHWYESDEHFCGGLAAYHSRRDAMAEEIAALKQANKPIPPDLDDYLKKSPLYKIEQCPDLPSAVPYLLKLGFKPMPKP